jgi:hypothetical protein
MTPGQTQLMRMFEDEYCNILASPYRHVGAESRTSIASLFVNEITAAFDAQYAASTRQQH